ncbi:MAG: hypothetical protein ACOYNI_06405 [Acidimicrobiia bacterium]
MTAADATNPLVLDAPVDPPRTPRARGRLSRGVVENEIRQPLESVARSLQRLSLQDIGESSTAHLVRRARALVNELVELTEELADTTAPAAGPVTRAAQERVQLHALVDHAASEVRDHFDRRVQVDIDPTLALTTDPPRVHTILVNVLAAGSRTSTDTALHASAQWDDRVLQVVVTWARSPSDEPAGDGDPGLVLARTLARSLGGDLELHTGELVTAALRLPQYRTGDS